ncbi:hypothetical protein RvY_05516-1 [Ramazzottius varieornatus]|uniref:Uncharacterized protein n=1 Tax=Ramazzottius varieornatus TaxID=947166 RepID=A0A1D1V1Z6_RAMVA|nr:hypothetical protein RvY_05516-1 [Ramazzottius varieornatus]
MLRRMTSRILYGVLPSSNARFSSTSVCSRESRYVTYTTSSGTFFGIGQNTKTFNCLSPILFLSSSLLECSLKFLGPLIFSLVLGNRRTKDLAGQGRDSFVRSALQMRFEDVVGTEASNPSQWMLL